MRLQQALDYLRVIPRFSSTVGFTGGEPFLYYRDIVTLTSEAKSLGLQVSLVTGAGWVRTEAQARFRVEALVDAGLNGLCISWDQYHEAFSPPEKAVALARLAIELGLKVTIRTITSASRAEDEYHRIFDGLSVGFEASRVNRFGRAASLPAAHFVFANDLPKGNCRIVFSPVVEPDGTVYACCGPSHYSKKPSPLMLGNATAEPLEDILARAVQDPILEIIFNLGPYGLYHLLKDHPLGRERFEARSVYTSICDLCLDITNDPELVSAVRERLSDDNAQRLVAVSRLWMDKKS